MFLGKKHHLFGLILLFLASFAQADNKIEITTYYHNDHTGSPVAASDENGNIIWRKEYSPYGEELNKDPKAAGDRRGFTGHVQDQDLGLVYMQARYYDPVLGRFMAIDPMNVNPEASMTFNRYAYANNNPYKYVDPDGQVGKLINYVGKVVKHKGNPVKAGKEWIGDVADSASTLADPSASPVDKGLAVFDLVSPLSTKDIKNISKAAARKQVMREQGIPTSQQPISQSKNASGREYQYEVPKPGGGTEIKSVQDQTLDISHPGQGHWEAGTVKTDPLTGEVRMNNYGRAKLSNDKSKANYDE